MKYQSTNRLHLVQYVENPNTDVIKSICLCYIQRTRVV